MEFRLVITDDDQWIEKLHRIGHRDLSKNKKSGPNARVSELGDGGILPDEPFWRTSLQD